MDRSEIPTDPAIIEWKRHISPAEATWSSYLQTISQYCTHVQTMPVDLITEAEAEQRITPRLRKHRLDLLMYKESMESKGNAPKTIRKFLAVMRSFYGAFDIAVDFGKLKRTPPREEHTKIPSRENIQEVLEIAGPMERAMVLAGCSSGLGMNELIHLRIESFWQGYDESTGITTLYVRREKSQYDHITFFSPEASRAIVTYLQYRNLPCTSTNKDLIKASMKQQAHDTGYLFVKEHIPDKYLETHDEELRKHSRSSYGAAYRDMTKILQHSKPNGEWGLIRSHNLRKVFYSSLINSGCDSMVAEYWMGHTLDATRGAYFRASPDKLREMYMRYVPALTIQPILDIEQSEEYQQAISEKNALASLHIKRDLQYDMELRKYKDRMDEMEKKLEQISIEKLAAEVEKIVLMSEKNK